MNTFDYGTMKPVVIGDSAEIRDALRRSDYPSCEYAFGNLIIWTEAQQNRMAVFNNRMYFHFSAIDELLFPCGDGMPAPEELKAFSDGMRAASYSGIIAHVPAAYLNTPGLEQYFAVQPMDDGNDEYIYRTETLAELRGSKLSKKRNLISQFERLYGGNYELKPVANAEDFRIITELSEHWLREHQDSRSIENERLAIAAALAHFEELGLHGLMLSVGGELKAYAVFSPVNSDSCTVHFEKALPECKGASQVITNQTAICLRGKCAFINREQDLNIPGLRRAKLSYMPDIILKDYQLIPKP